MKKISLENSIIRLIIKYLILRNILLISLLTYLAVTIYSPAPNLKFIVLVIVVISGALTIFHLIKVIHIKAKNYDSKVIQSFSDEYFKITWIKAGYHGFVAMLTVSLLVVILSVILTSLKIQIFIPLYLTEGIVIFGGVLVFDISKIIQIRNLK